MSKTLSEGAKALRLSVSLALAAGLASTAPAAIAQDEAAALEQRVQVTGSRIKRVDVETTSPVTVVTSEQILASGLQNIGDVLRNLNQADALGLTNLTTATNANDGTQTISLRGLGPARTLVLVNGRRWLALGGGQVDITQVPVALVQRIEVLGDGASAIYGSDAIGGVINIILRDDYDGLEVELGMGANFEGDGEHRSYGITLGTQGARSGIALNISKTEQNPIWAGDREISRYPVAFVPISAQNSAFGEYGIFNVPGTGLVCLNPAANQNITNPADRTPQDFVAFNDHCRFNFAPTNYLLTPSDRLTAYSGGHYDVTDTTRAFFQFTYNQRKSITEIAAVPLTMGFSGPQWNFPISAQNLWNPFGVDIPASGFRMSPLGGGRINHQDYDTYFVTSGLEGMFTLMDRTFDWDFAFSRGESSRSTIGYNYVNLLNLQRGLGPSFINADGVPTCGTPQNPTPVHGAVPCVPINMFNGVTGWTQEMLDFVSYTLVQNIHTGMNGWEVNMSGSIVDLPAGPMGVAVGFERRTNTFTDTPDALIDAGFSSNNFREPTSGTQTAEEFYFEFAVPLVRDVPFAQMLEFTAAGRFSEFENDGFVGNTRTTRAFDNDSFKFGLLWQPMDDLLVRASYGDTFRAPSVANLYQGGGEGFVQANDPCSSSAVAGAPYDGLTAEQQARCHAQGVPVGGAPQQTSQIRQMSGGNPNLLPESGDTMVVGFVYNPGWLPGFDMSVDAWRVNLQDALSFRGTQLVLNDCILEGDLTFCPPNNPNQFIERTGTGEIQTVRASNFNLANIRISGADFSGNYRFDTAGMGSFRISANATYTYEALLTLGALSEANNVVGRGAGALAGPTWKWRSSVTTNWNYGDFGVTWTVRYLSPLIENCTAFFATAFTNELATRELCTNPDTPWIPNFNNLDADGNPVTAPGFHRIGSHIYHDLSGSWRAPWNATIRAGVRNVFDKQPPFMITPFANSFDHAYDIPGPFWFVSYRQAL